MMKRIAALLIALRMMGAVALATGVTTSASVADYYASGALTGDDLMNAINSFTGTYLVASANEDGTPNVAYFVFSMVKHEDKYYLQLGLAANQSKANLEARPYGMAVYAANPAEGAPLTTSGARIWFDALEDASLAETLNTSGRPGAMFFEVTAIRPVG